MVSLRCRYHATHKKGKLAHGMLYQQYALAHFYKIPTLLIEMLIQDPVRKTNDETFSKNSKKLPKKPLITDQPLKGTPRNPVI